MTEQLTSPSNCSIDCNLLKFNSSSSCCLVSPSQSNFGSHLKNNIVQFQQYKCQAPIENISKKLLSQPAPSTGLGKKKLTILIDEIYDDDQNSRDIEKFQNYGKIQKQQKIQKNKLKITHGFDQDSSAFEQRSGQIDGLEIISPIQNKNSLKCYQLQQNLREVQKQLDNAHAIITKKEQKIKHLQQQLHDMQKQLDLKNQHSQSSNKLINTLQYSLQQKEQLIRKLQNQLQQKEQLKVPASYMTEIQQKIKQKDSKIRQMVKINQKLKNLNKDLIREVKVSQKKVRDLQKQLQNNLCLATQENIHRLKQSSLKIKQKENMQRYNCTNYTHHTKTQRDSIHAHNNLNTTKQKQKQKETSFAGTTNLNGRKSLQRKKNVSSNTTSAGQFAQPKKPGSAKMTSLSNSNPLLNKKLMHK